MNPSPIQPFLSAPLWEKTMHYIKVNIIFHLHPVEIAYFQFNHFFLTFYALCKKCFLTLWGMELPDNVPVSTTHGQQPGSQMHWSQVKCHNKMDEQSFARMLKSRRWGGNQLPSFYWRDAHVLAAAADAPSLCWHGATGLGSADSAVFPCPVWLWSGPGFYWCHSTDTHWCVTGGRERWRISRVCQSQAGGLLPWELRRRRTQGEERENRNNKTRAAGEGDARII